MRIGVCGGSFDPPTLGHLDLFREGSNIFDKIVVVVAKNPRKNNLFTAEERKLLIKKDAQKVGLKNIEVVILGEGQILANYANKIGASALVRSMRTVTDFETEFEMALHNKMQAPNITTVFVRINHQFDAVRSSSVRDLARLGGRIDYMVTKNVEEAIRKKLSQK
jgi:pantetheine-phosphate adenylyltransferase